MTHTKQGAKKGREKKSGGKMRQKLDRLLHVCIHYVVLTQLVWFPAPSFVRMRVRGKEVNVYASARILEFHYVTLSQVVVVSDYVSVRIIIPTWRREQCNAPHQLQQQQYSPDK